MNVQGKRVIKKAAVNNILNPSSSIRLSFPFSFKVHSSTLFLRNPFQYPSLCTSSMSNNFLKQSRHGLLKSPKCSVSFNLVKIQFSPELENVPLCPTVTLPEGVFVSHHAFRRAGPRVHATSRIAIQLLVG